MAKPKLTPEERDIARRVARNAARIAAEWNKPDPMWPDRFKALEAELLAEKPHLAEHEFCKLIVETPDDVPRKRVVMPNGIVFYSSWYKVPTTEADGRLAMRETKWLNEEGKKKREAEKKAEMAA